MAVDAPSLALLSDNWALFQDPIVVAAVAGGVLGYLGVFILARRMVFVAAALTQAAGLGVALAFAVELLGVVAGPVAEPRLWAIGVALFAAWALGYPRARGLSREGLLALAYLIGGAGVLLLGTRLHQETHDIDAILFGSGVLVGPEDVRWVLLAGALTLALQIWWRRGFLFASLDPDGARVRGLPVSFLDAVLLFQIAAMVSIATRALGALPVFAFSVVPALAASILVRSPKAALVLALVLGALGGAGGYLFAFFGEFPVGASQTVVTAVPVLVALLFRSLVRGRN